MNKDVSISDRTPPALQMAEGELMQVLQTSLYPGASPASIKMALGYCKAANLDPMQKPVHIVPMWDSSAGQMRDVIMPGIGLYRTQAARNGCAGVSEPEFGPDVTASIGGAEITYPQWCRVTVKRRLATGEIAEFAAKELWVENYAVKGGKERSVAPNAMWTKRPYGQLAKCAEAQALRKAFPEIGSEPTADEMHGKSINDYEPAQRSIDPPAPVEYPAADFSANLPKWRKVIESGRKTPDEIIAMVETKGTLSEKQREAILALEPIEAEAVEEVEA